MDPRRLTGLTLAAGSGLLYGSINVAAKPLDLHPAWLGALMYLTSAAVLLPFTLRLRLPPRDIPKVLAMGLLGGGLAPLLLLAGLREAAASDAGLLLTMEMVATAAFAAIFLHERYAGRELVGLGALLCGAVFVALAGRDTGQSSLLGMGLVLASAVTWGIDNTVSTRLVGSHAPASLIGVKGILGGCVSLVALAILEPDLPTGKQAAAGAGLGIASIAVSSMMFYFALQKVGAGRTSAMNIATTALVAAAGGALVLDEQLSWLHLAALAAVGTGAWLLSRHATQAPQPAG